MSAAPTTAEWLRQAARRISRGSSYLTWALAGRVTRGAVRRGRAWKDSISAWLREASGLNWCFRVALLVGAGLLARKILLGTAGPLLRRLEAASWLLWPAVLAWLVAAWRAAPKAEEKAARERKFVELLRALIGDRNGVLLRSVVEVLRREDPAVDFAHVRVQCEALGIPVRDSLKVDDDVSPGVHLDDLLDVWDVQLTPPPPQERPRHSAVTRHNYPTTSDGDSGGGGVECIEHESSERPEAGLTTGGGADFEDHLTDALNVLNNDRQRPA